MLDRFLLNNTLADYGIALGWFVGGLLIAAVLKHIIVRRLEHWASKTKTLFDDFLVAAFGRTAIPALAVASFYAAIHHLRLSPVVHHASVIITKIVLTYLAVRLLVSLVKFVLMEAWARNHPDQAALQPRIQGLLPIVTVFLWAIGAVFLLDNLGFKISTVIAGLGIGGVAVALGAQAVLGDLFAYVAILFDQPFVIGDAIKVGDSAGVVERIGIKTTRVRSASGELLVFANKDLTDSRLQNFARMTERRIVFTIGAAYDTPTSVLRDIPGLIKEVVLAQKDVRFDRAHFRSMDASQLTFEAVYFVTTGDYLRYMDIQQSINLALKEAFDQRKISIPFPTQTVHLQTVVPPRG